MKGSKFTSTEWGQSYPLKCNQCGINAGLRQIIHTAWTPKDGHTAWSEEMCDPCLEKMQALTPVIQGQISEEGKEYVQFCWSDHPKAENIGQVIERVAEIYEYMGGHWFKDDSGEAWCIEDLLPEDEE